MLPPGTIIIWSGAIINIPAGFVLCDGNNGTPDLRDRFVRGAGGGLPVDVTGGDTEHAHTYTGTGHVHAFLAGIGIAAGTDHSDVVSPTAVSGTTGNTDHIPPYHALAYIMKT